MLNGSQAASLSDPSGSAQFESGPDGDGKHQFGIYSEFSSQGPQSTTFGGSEPVYHLPTYQLFDDHRAYGPWLPPPVIAHLSFIFLIKGLLISLQTRTRSMI